MVISRTSQTEICGLEFVILTSTPQSDQRPCPLCGALERRLVFQRDGWHVVKCSACNMVFIGDQPLAYGTQAAEHDWADDYEKEVSRRKKDRPLLMFFSRPGASFRTRFIGSGKGSCSTSVAVTGDFWRWQPGSST
jgi:uncharacterized C2H2 Zn-finger protein